MAVTKIVARSAPPDVGVRYVLNGEKTDDQVLTAAQRCTTEYAAERMRKTKERYNKTGGVQYYHIIQSFRPGEVTPELALEIAQEFVRRNLPDYEAVIGTHVDRQHIHSHIIFNSVNAVTGEKYHSNVSSYYRQIRAVSDKLCREHGLSVIIQDENPGKAVSYIEWLRQSKGQPTFRSMLEADLRESIEDANDFGHFLLLMENKGWEIKHGNRLAFRLRGQERYMVPGRKNKLFTEDGIRAAIEDGLAAIEAGQRPIIIERPRYQPYRKRAKYRGFLALYAHYLYVLGKIEKHEYPPRMTAQMRESVVRFEQYREQFALMRENGITTKSEMDAFTARAEETIAALKKQRTILNVRKKRRKALYDALVDAEALSPARACYENGVAGLENELELCMEAEETLNHCGILREQLAEEKAALYEEIAEVNRAIRAEKKKLRLCGDITDALPGIERDLDTRPPWLS